MLFGYYEQNITLECFKNHIFANNSHHIVGKLQSCLKSEINYLEVSYTFLFFIYFRLNNGTLMLIMNLLMIGIEITLFLRKQIKEVILYGQ